MDKSSKISFYGSKISDNILLTPEKYLICKNVPLARTGTQEYYAHEILDEHNQSKYSLTPNDKVIVHRRPEDVLSQSFILSFEGKSFTNDHPRDFLDVDNVYDYEMGHLQNIRAGEEGETIVGDIVVKDKEAIKAIMSGKREVSCGYDFKLAYNEEEDKYYQIPTIGNHVALVNRGRAGNDIKIYDHKGEKMSKEEEKEKSSIMARILKSFAKDASPEELDEAIDAMSSNDDDASKEASKTLEEGKTTDSPFEQRFAELEKKVNTMIEIFEKKAEAKTKYAAENLAELEATKDEEPKEAKDTEEEANTEAKDSEENKEEAKDSAEELKAADARAKLSAEDDKVYAQIASMKATSVEYDMSKLGDEIAKACNPHYKTK